MSKSNKNRTVFIGNIAFDAQEEELRQLFQQVGPISNLRIVVDRETGKRKGFGFVEYSDQETALAAVRNLDNSEVKGRTLRVNIAEQDTKSSSDQASMMAEAGSARAGHPTARRSVVVRCRRRRPALWIIFSRPSRAIRSPRTSSASAAPKCLSSRCRRSTLRRRSRRRRRG